MASKCPRFAALNARAGAPDTWVSCSSILSLFAVFSVVLHGIRYGEENIMYYLGATSVPTFVIIHIQCLPTHKYFPRPISAERICNFSKLNGQVTDICSKKKFKVGSEQGVNILFISHVLEQPTVSTANTSSGDDNRSLNRSELYDACSESRHLNLSQY